MGQYTQPNPIGLEGGNPTLYSYVSNPNWWIDPLGLERTGSAPVGSRHNQMNQPSNVYYQPIRNTPTTINGRPYSGHALDRMQDRGILPSAIDNTLRYGVPSASRGGTTIFYEPINNITVVTNSNGLVVTVRYGR